jgi:tetratricopeptide (TPR) repeat protein
MDAVTYPHGGVERRLNNSFVAFKPQIDRNDALARRFLVTWTPGIIFVDGLENIHYRAYGYHPPEDFEHLLDVGRGMVEFNRNNYQGALPIFAGAAEESQRTGLQPEALFWMGVCQYKTGDKEGMIRTWTRLLDLYPQDLWGKKASIIRPLAAAA